MDNPDEIYRLYCYISKQVFYNVLNQAKKKGLFVDKDGRVDIGSLMAELVISFSEGKSKIEKRNDAIIVGETE